MQAGESTLLLISLTVQQPCVQCTGAAIIADCTARTAVIGALDGPIVDICSYSYFGIILINNVMVTFSDLF